MGAAGFLFWAGRGERPGAGGRLEHASVVDAPAHDDRGVEPGVAAKRDRIARQERSGGAIRPAIRFTKTRAVAIPKLQATGNYQTTTETEAYPFPNPPPAQGQTWNANIRASCRGDPSGPGQIRAALRSAKFTKEEALLNYQTVIADALLQARIAYYDVLSAKEQIAVEEASVKLLTQQLDDQTRRWKYRGRCRAVLQAESGSGERAAEADSAANVYRVAKNNLVNQLGEAAFPWACRRTCRWVRRTNWMPMSIRWS